MTLVGMIGLGTMGRPMAEHLATKHDVLVWNRTPKTVQMCTSVAKPSDVARAEIIFTCVRDDAALEEVLFGTDGLFSAELTGKTLVDCSTVSVPLVEKIAARMSEKGGVFLDAPITGSKIGAESGSMMFMVGGDRKQFDRLIPVFETMGKKFVYCGPSTYGQRAKLALNLTQALILESYLEGCAFAMKNGVPLATIREILDNSGAKNAVGGFKLPFIEKRDFTPHFKAALMHKDVKLAQDEMARIGITLPLSAHIADVFSKVPGDEDMGAIAKVLEEQVGISFSEKN